MQSKTTKKFWKQFDALPQEVQKKAKEVFAQWKKNTESPEGSLHFKPLEACEPRSIYSIWIGHKWRAMAEKMSDKYVWFWIGPHEAYNKLTTGKKAKTVSCGISEALDNDDMDEFIGLSLFTQIGLPWKKKAPVLKKMYNRMLKLANDEGLGRMVVGDVDGKATYVFGSLWEHFDLNYDVILNDDDAANRWYFMNDLSPDRIKRIAHSEHSFRRSLPPLYRRYQESKSDADLLELIKSSVLEISPFHSSLCVAALDVPSLIALVYTDDRQHDSHDYNAFLESYADGDPSITPKQIVEAIYEMVPNKEAFKKSDMYQKYMRSHQVGSLFESKFNNLCKEILK